MRLEREYQKPEVEVVSLVTEVIANDFFDGEMGTGSSVFPAIPRP